MSEVVLATLNAKFIHASMGLRCLLANLDRHGKPGLRARTSLREFTIEQRTAELCEALLGPEPAAYPRLIGLGVYIWNVTESTALVRMLKAVAPQVKLILGGPEVSFEQTEQPICQLADHTITGWGDVSFAQTCATLLDGSPTQRAVLPKVITGIQPTLDELNLPYAEYTDGDLAHRLLYVEASRGCPFKCEFCLSSLDKTAWAFDLDGFLAEMQTLVQRGAQHFKFVDRTFNLKIETSARILKFFLGHLAAGKTLFVHFEVVPDVLPDRLKELIAQFPPGSLQFEVGVQTFTPEVQQRISRKQDEAKTMANIAWLVDSSPAHLHTDLIFGLPGETLDTFAASFDQLSRLRPHEVQFGMLKRLRGTPIIRHTADWGMVYDPEPPYVVLQTSTLSFATVQRVGRMARYWEIVANSGRFSATVNLLLGLDDADPEASALASPFWRFLDFSDWLWATTAKTHAFAPDKLLDFLFEHLQGRMPVHAVQAAILKDWQASGMRKLPQCLVGVVDEKEIAKLALARKKSVEGQGAVVHGTERQARALA